MATSTSSRSSSVAAARGRLPAPVRDRRPALAALALLLVIGGALISALVVYRSGDRVDVLVANREIALGEQVQESDFRTARVAAECAAYVEATAVSNFAGTRATGSIPEGTLINRNMFFAGSVVPTNGALIGVVLSAAQRPVTSLRQGDVVSVFSVPAETGTATATLLLPAVRVAEVSRSSDGDGQGVSLLVPADRAEILVAATTTGQVSVARLAPETVPVLDFVQE